MFIKVRCSNGDLSYYDTTKENFGVCCANYSHYGSNFFYFKLFPQWFSYTTLQEEGKFKTREQVEKVAEIIINSIIEEVKIIDLNEIIKKVKTEIN